MMHENSRVKKKNDLLISVVVPVYNMAQTLSRCLDSIVNQTFNQIEIILVDDGSTDGSGTLCDYYMQQDNRIKVFHIENQGLVNARKRGVLAATGDYVCFVDSDDYIDINAVQSMYHMTENGELDMVGCGCFIDNHGTSGWMGNLAASGVYEGVSFENLKGRMMYDMQKCGPAVFQSASCKLFRKSILSKVIMLIDNQITIGEDAAIVYGCLLNAKKIVLSDCGFYHYVVRDNSMTQSKNNSFFEKIYLFQKYMKNSFAEYDTAYKLEKQLNWYLLHLIDMGTANVYGIRHNKDIMLMKDPKLHGKKVVLYGAGKAGKKYYLQILRENTMDVIAWVDKRLAGEKIYYREIQPPEIIREEDFDYVLIGVTDKNMMMEIKKELVELCDEDKLVWNPGVMQYSGKIDFANEG